MPLPCILFVDDDERVLRSLQSIFRRTYRVLTATHAVEALKILQSESIDIVVSDQRMPEMMGDELLGKIAVDYPHIVRILLTGYADNSITIDAINKGEIYAFIAKPWDYDEIKSTIADAVLFAQAPVEQPTEEIKLEPVEDSVVHELDTAEPEPEVSQPTSSDNHSLPLSDDSQKVLPALLMEYSQSIRNIMRLKCRKLHCTLYSVSAQRHIPGMLRIRPDISVLIIGLENQAEAVQIINSVKEQNPNIVAIGLTEDAESAQHLVQQNLLFALLNPTDNDETYLSTMLAASEHFRQLLLPSVKLTEKAVASRAAGFSKIKNIISNH